MKRITRPVGLVLTALAVLSLTRSGVAQQVSENQVPFTATLTCPFRSLVIVGDPTVVSAQGLPSTMGTSVGPFNHVAHLLVRAGVDGKPLWGDGVAALTAANGDALYMTFSGLFRRPATATSTVFPFEAVYSFTGGRGRFAGATGSGLFRGEVNFASDFASGTTSAAFDGTVSAPRGQ